FAHSIGHRATRQRLGLRWPSTAFPCAPERGSVSRSAPNFRDVPSESEPFPGSEAAADRSPVVFRRRFALSAQPHFPPPRKRRRGPGRGGAFYQFPLSPALSPLVPRGEREANTASLLRAEHNWRPARV